MKRHFAKRSHKGRGHVRKNKQKCGSIQNPGEERMYTRSNIFPLRFALQALLFCLSLPVLAQSGATTVRRDVHHDVSPPLGEMIKHAPPPSLARRPVEPMKLIPLPPGLIRFQEDPVIQTVTVPPPTPPVSQSFEGLGNGQYGFSVTGAPPDTNGTVGSTQYVQWVNTSFAIFNKSNGALIAGPTAGNTLWSGFGGGCQTNNDGDASWSTTNWPSAGSSVSSQLRRLPTFSALPSRALPTH